MQIIVSFLLFYSESSSGLPLPAWPFPIHHVTMWWWLSDFTSPVWERPPPSPSLSLCLLGVGRNIIKLHSLTRCLVSPGQTMCVSFTQKVCIIMLMIMMIVIDRSSRASE